MALLLMIPFTVITYKAVKSKNEAARELEKKPEPTPSIYAVNHDTTDANFEYRRRRQETMRSEASQLQAELGRIKSDTESWRRVEKMTRWKLKCEIHFSLYADLYADMDEFASDVKFSPRLLEALTELGLG